MSDKQNGCQCDCHRRVLETCKGAVVCCGKMLCCSKAIHDEWLHGCIVGAVIVAVSTLFILNWFSTIDNVRTLDLLLDHTIGRVASIIGVTYWIFAISRFSRLLLRKPIPQ